MSTKQTMERREVHYEGRVQGVGFRYRTAAIAERYSVVGYVRNLSDGRVQLVAEGNVGELERFLAEVASEMRGNIHDAPVTTLPPTGEFTGFSIRR